MASPDDLVSDLNNLLTPPPGEKKQEDNFIALVPGAYLDDLVEQKNQTPRLMEAVKDETGILLIRKYEKLTKPIWKKYRSKPECRPIHFISEAPLWVIEDVNTTFLIPEDFQFLGAYYAQQGNVAAADQFFNEALKAATADAFINTGVFRYRLGEYGVIDNFKVAKRHFNKALGILHNMLDLSVDDKYKRRKLCLEAVDEIDYRFSSFFDKLFKFIIRLLTLKFEPAISYVGAAAPVDPLPEKWKQMTETILKKEFNMKVEATRKFLADLQDKIPAAQSHLEEELHEIVADYGDFRTPELLETAVVRLGEFYAQNLPLLERHSAGAAVGGTEAAGGGEPESIDDLCFGLANAEDIERTAAKNRLRSSGELVDLASNPAVDSASIAWLIKDKLDQVDVMERLYKNPNVPADIKKFIQKRHSFPATETQ